MIYPLYFIMISLFTSFSRLVVFLYILNDTESPQISWSLLSVFVGLKQCCDPNGLDSSSDFRFLQSSFKFLGTNSKRINYNCYYCQCYVLELFSFGFYHKVQIFVYLFTYFFSMTRRNSKIHSRVSSFFFLINNSWSVFLDGIWSSFYISKFQRILCNSFSWMNTGCAYTIWYNGHIFFISCTISSG